MGANLEITFRGFILSLHFVLIPFSAYGLDVAATAKTLRLSNTITGGLMPASNPVFEQMRIKVQAGDIKGAALLATTTSYYVNYLAKRLAYQMQSPALDSNIITDSDATAFLIAHLAEVAGQKPSISTIWSENATYLANVMVAGVPTQIHASSLTAAQLATINWQTDLVRVAGQAAKTAAGVPIPIPLKHVGGYVTLSDKPGDNSFSMYGATAGTNLRMIEGLWQIATGLTLVDVQSSYARPQDVPRFIPEYDVNFFKGQGQAACISCHGGGFSSLNHGYATVADTFDYVSNVGLVYIATPTTATKKSLGSDPQQRTINSVCDLTKIPTPVCNPDSIGADPNQAWDLNATWSSTGTLLKMGWSGLVRGEGLNQLGQELGKAAIVFKFLTKRIVREICPMGTFSEEEIGKIADLANPYALVKGTDDVRTLIAEVAAHESCQ